MATDWSPTKSTEVGAPPTSAPARGNFLLVTPTETPGVTAGALDRLAPTSFVLLGGQVAIGEPLVAPLRRRLQ